MIAGLEFLKSWRYWLVLTASTSAIMLGAAGAHIASVLYFPPRGGEPDSLYPLLAGFVLFWLGAGLFWLFYWRNAQIYNEPEEHSIRFFLGVIFATSIVVILERVSVNRLILEPIVSGESGPGFSYLAAYLFGIVFGPVIARIERTAMIGAGSDADRSATPDLP